MSYGLSSVEHNGAPAPSRAAQVPASSVSSSSGADSSALDEKHAAATAAFKGTGRQTPNGVHELLADEIYPEDIYVNGVYWADLPAGERVKFAVGQSNREAKRELGVVGSMFKKDPLSPINEYFSRYVITGFGLFTEGSTLFSIGNLTPLFQAVWPACWKNYQTCSKEWVHSIEYLEIIGIIFGQILVGFEGDWIGRRAGLVQDALIMFIGLVMLTGSWGVTLEGWVIMYAWSLFIYGIGVGGEYPMTSTSSLEARSGVSAGQLREDRLHRGRSVALSFLMQGWGQLFNQVILIVLLLIFHHSGSPPYSEVSAQLTFRLQFAIVALMTLWLAYHRWYHGQGAAMDKKLRAAKRKQGAVTGYDTASLKLAISHFGPRMIGTAGCWFAADFFFYGSKLFQSTFIKVIIPANATVMDGWLYNLINIAVSLCGYYLAALLMDHKLYGRVRMQAVGFTCMFILILMCAVFYPRLVTRQWIHAFQAIYYLSSFFTQFGPNSTTFLLAAEVYPTSIRATAHGVSAACGKLGALAPAILYNYIDTRTKFWVVTWFGLLGLFLTVAFIPDTTGLDLREQERYWRFVRAGRAEDYHGIAVHARHLSMWEKVVCKRHLAYDAEKDRQMKMDELSETYARNLARKYAENPDYNDHDENDDLSDNVKSYFEYQAMQAQKRGEKLPLERRPTEQPEDVEGISPAPVF